MKDTGFKIRQYSLFAGSFLLMRVLKAGVEYTNIDPDIILDSDFESAGVDMNNNGHV